MGIKMLRGALLMMILMGCVFGFTACDNSSSSKNNTPALEFPSAALSDIGINIVAPNAGRIGSVHDDKAGSIEVAWVGISEAAANSFFVDMQAAVSSAGIIIQDDADIKSMQWEHTHGEIDYAVRLIYEKQTDNMTLTVNPRPAFPSEALAAIGIDINKPAGPKIDEVQNDGKGTIEVKWVSVAAADADNFTDSMATALIKAGAVSKNDDVEKVVTWDHTSDVEYEVTITFIKQDHELNGVAVNAGDMLLNIHPKSQTPDLVLDDSIRRVAAYVAFNVNFYNGYKLGIIKGNSNVDNLSVDVRIDTMPQVHGVDANEAKVFAYGKRPKDGSATVVLERYSYAAAGSEGKSVFTTFDANGTINESTIAANVQSWGSPSNPNYASNAYNTVRMGNYLYIISYDVPRISKVNLTTGSLVSSVEMSPVEGFSVKGQDIAIVNGRIFALFAMPDSAYANYKDSVVIEVKHTNNDKAPTFGQQVAVGKNAVNMVPVDNYIYVPSIGGAQHNNASNGAESRIDRITLTTGGMTVAPVYYVDDDYDFHGLMIGKEKTLIVRVMLDSTYYTTYAYLTALNTADLHTVNNKAISTIPAANNIIDEEMQNGYMYSMAYDDVRDQFWFAPTGKLTVYNKDLSKHKDFNMKNELYGVRVGTIASIALFNSELGTVAKVGTSYVPHAVKSGLFRTPEEYYKSLK